MMNCRWLKVSSRILDMVKKLISHHRNNCVSIKNFVPNNEPMNVGKKTSKTFDSVEITTFAKNKHFHDSSKMRNLIYFFNIRNCQGELELLKNKKSHHRRHFAQQTEILRGWFTTTPLSHTLLMLMWLETFFLFFFHVVDVPCRVCVT